MPLLPHRPSTARSQKGGRRAVPAAALLGTLLGGYALASPPASAQARPAAPTVVTLPTPSNPSVTSTVDGTSITWGGVLAPGYRIAQATNASMTTGRRTYTVTSEAEQLTPYGLTRGKRYYFRVSAFNGSLSSPYSAQVSAVVQDTEQKLRVLTYNIMASSTAGQIESGRPLASWAKRRSKVVKLIRAGSPDVVAVQEGNGWVGEPEGYGGERQVDDIAPLLADESTGPAYVLASTEVPPTSHGYLRTGRYIFYKRSAFIPAAAGGHWEIGAVPGQRWAAYQLLESRTTGARFLFVSVHLSYVAGPDGDAQREAETKRLIEQASAYAADQHVPVVYAGDFNSHAGSNHPVDGPAIEFRAVHATDAFEVAQTRVNARYNSANQNLRTPPANGRSIDHVFAPAGVALRSWRLRLDLTDGEFVGTIPSDHNPLTVDVTLPLVTTDQS